MSLKVDMLQQRSELCNVDKVDTSSFRSKNKTQAYVEASKTQFLSEAPSASDKLWPTCVSRRDVFQANVSFGKTRNLFNFFFNETFP